MAKNKPYGDSARKGEVKKRMQVYNPKNKRWTEIDTTTNKFINQKADKYLTFKGVRKYK